MVSRGTETEVKIRVANADEMSGRLRGLHFEVSAPRIFEANTLYDTADGRLRTREMILRLREAGEKYVLTWKGPGAPGPHKNRAELETNVGSLKIVHEILGRLEYQPKFRYEKYRTEFTQIGKAEGTATIDETPIGNFVELEGPGQWIDATAQALGFSPDDYVLDSYGKLYQDYCKTHGVQPENMVWTSQST